MKIVVASKNPCKIEGVQKALLKFFENVEVLGIETNSDVPDQPVNDEIMTGAKNRAINLRKYCRKNNINADLYISTEAGISSQLGNWLALSISYIIDNDSFESYGSSPGIPLPEKYVAEIKKTNFAVLLTKIIENYNIEESKVRGGVFYLTKGLLTRTDLNELAVIMALTKYINDYWKD